KYHRLKLLLANDLNLFAFHLPLDAQPQFGNNAQLGERLGLIADGQFGDQGLGQIATLPMPVSLEHFTAKVERVLNRAPLVIGDPDQ
ncbi:Nif3-like dinuclear metal center hexameric protein, partial [Klebsiella pneumoniae]|uniref:Nif3-like dinuclear metal center hexameric protein n=1 Tax=Klebsiella pneumoniae TaxID=573 RepID=UPI00256EF3BD